MIALNGAGRAAEARIAAESIRGSNAGRVAALSVLGRTDEALAALAAESPSILSVSYLLYDPAIDP